MKKEPFFFDKERQKSELKKIEFVSDSFQLAIDAYKAIPGLPELTSSDLISFYNSPRTFVANHLIEKNNINFGGLKIKTQKVFELFPEPDGLSELEELQKSIRIKIGQYCETNSRKGAGLLLEPSIGDFELIDGKIKVRDGVFADIDKKCERHLNERQEKIYEELNRFADSLYKLANLYGDSQFELKDVLRDAYGLYNASYTDHSAKRYEVNKQYLLTL